MTSPNDPTTHPTDAAEGLTVKQRKFAEHYAQSGNATEAARLAGYKGAAATLAVQGRENLKNPKVGAYLRSLTAQADASRIATATERQEFLTAVMRGKVLVTVKPAGEDAQEYETSADLKDRLKAVELLGRMQGDFIEKREVTMDLPPVGLTFVLPDGTTVPGMAAPDDQAWSGPDA